ncbi:hypothetical protein UMZ34_17945 [Halopseudomonas pachastrellae]|nr:hypothetical protein UMZ34_17945 [Halopseudomonas pachastrellae]
MAALYADQAPSQGLRLQALDWPQAPGWLVCAGDEEPVLLEQARCRSGWATACRRWHPSSGCWRRQLAKLTPCRRACLPTPDW